MLMMMMIDPKVRAAKVVAENDTKFFWDSDCLAHQYQLMSGSAGWAIEEQFMPAFGDD